MFQDREPSRSILPPVRPYPPPQRPVGCRSIGALDVHCSSDEVDAGPLNNRMPPAEARKKVGALLEGSMRRTLVVPISSDPPPPPPRSAFQVGTRGRRPEPGIMTRMGTVARERPGARRFVPGLHSLGDPDPERRFICHLRGSVDLSVGFGHGGTPSSRRNVLRPDRERPRG
jgi:phosphoenolpyruvate carboxykinase (GTP)